MRSRDTRGSDADQFGKHAEHTWLSDIDRLIDWTRLDRFFHWLPEADDLAAEIAESVLLKALLLQNWFALSAVECDRKFASDPPFRRFLGLAPDQAAPDHTAIYDFRRLLLERGVAVEVISCVREQLEDLRETSAVNEHPGLDDGSLDTLIASLQPLGPPEWEEMERRFLAFWREKKAGSKTVPALGDVKLSELSDLLPYATLIRVMDNGEFRYEWVGDNIRAANANSITGETLENKVSDNIEAYGHPGLQAELSHVFRLAVTQRKPVATSTYYFNADGNKCVMWGVAAPFGESDDGSTMLIGLALIVPIPMN